MGGFILPHVAGEACTGADSWKSGSRMDDRHTGRRNCVEKIQGFHEI